MVKTFGLTHIAFMVKDMERSLRFYTEIFGVELDARSEDMIHVRSGDHGIITFVRDDKANGKTSGILHFGFRLTTPADIELAVREVERAGGKILRRGEFSPGLPYAYIADLDGYEVEVWYE